MTTPNPETRTENNRALAMLWRARDMARDGYGWEDLHVQTGLPRNLCREIVLRYPSPDDTRRRLSWF